MKVVVVTGMVAPYRVPVLECVARMLPGELHIVACAEREIGRQWRVEIGNVAVQTLRGLQIQFGPASVMHFNLGIIGALRRLGPTVLCFNGFTPTILLAAAYARSRSIPWVTQADTWSGGDPRFRSPVHRVLRKLVVRQSAAGIAIGEKSAAWMKFFGLKPDRLFISPLVPEWPRPQSVAPFADRPFDLLWCGTLAREKGVDLFIDVARGLLARRGRLAVRIVGDGPYRQQCETRLALPGLTAQFDGFLNGEAVRAAYLSVKLFLFPTLIDAWGLVATEAAQCGTPVIISPFAGAADEVVVDGKNGRVLPLDTQAWVEAADEILTDASLWSTFSAAGPGITADVRPEIAAREMVKAFVMAANAGA